MKFQPIAVSHFLLLILSIFVAFTFSSCANGGGGGGGDEETLGPVEVSLSIEAQRKLVFEWNPVENADHYRLLEDAYGSGNYSVVTGAESIRQTSYGHMVSIHLTDWDRARYIVEACNADNSLTEPSDPVELNRTMHTSAIGYFKASNTDEDDRFGHAVAVSADGSTLAVGAYLEDSSADGINGNESDNNMSATGAVYLYYWNGEDWIQQAYLKASNPNTGDNFGYSLDLSDNGNTLAVGAIYEDSTADNSGAVYLFVRNGSTWSQQAYLKASNSGEDDSFGNALALSGNGDTLAVGAYVEDSSADGINGDQADSSAEGAGAVYLFQRSGESWSQEAYIKASNSEANSENWDVFGSSVSLNTDGSVLAVGAPWEGSTATGINGDQSDNSADGAGAVYLFSRSGSTWIQEAYIKASNTDEEDNFGQSVSLSGDGATLAVGAPGEQSAATGINGDEFDNSLHRAGAVYIFHKDDTWSQQAYIKASVSEDRDSFGYSVALSRDGNTLVVGANYGDGGDTGIYGDATDNSEKFSGAVHVYQRSGSTWSHRNYLKASNTEGHNSDSSQADDFGFSVDVNQDGSLIAVGAVYEDSAATGIGGNQDDNSAEKSGAVYLY